MRITQRSLAVTALQGLNRNQEAISKLQAQLTSGKTINKPSDDPTGTNAAMQTRQELAGAAQYARNINDGIGLLDATDSALQNMIKQVQSVRAKTVAGLNDGALSGPSRAAYQTEVAGIRESLLGLANTTVQGVPVFGGVTSGSTAYDVTTGAYQGFGGTTVPPMPVVPVNRQVSDADTIRVDLTGPEAFGDPATGDLFSVVQSIATDLVDDPAALAGHLDDLDAVLNRMLTAAADIGTRTNRIETAQQVNKDLQLSLTSRSSVIENVDLPKTIMNLQMQQVGYEAALGATAKAIQPTLLDFLR
ncbi:MULTISPECIES: flagellar hook-associated protein FlgL [unclassified Modestobacter]|uniref:flagellar hook-associated protein FlgL n=1 Tax=unclassified Modestobacter TaxID=2643866 RepID=UPI0022AB3D03|nr:MULTISPECIES: flagellar hook-associated protein FlgL [unclassified Modestobacter]MCZ2825094.1 flagellar hook-associated protein FlgL [Modestobacter sp. VKM Ac-2981]MCZ2853841.1 flagellar hook-associated protein FlgL [Modestobacter sp. VKM Ac-2982]